MLDNVKLVDLTMPLDSNTVMWPGAGAPQAETVVTVKDFGRYARNVSFSEHAGTHVDAPSHFIDGGQNVDEIPLETLVRPIAMIDISSRIGSDADGELLLADVLAEPRQPAAQRGQERIAGRLFKVGRSLHDQRHGPRIGAEHVAHQARRAVNQG